MDIIVQFAAVFTFLLYKYVFTASAELLEFTVLVLVFCEKLSIYYWHFIGILGKIWTR